MSGKPGLEGMGEWLRQLGYSVLLYMFIDDARMTLTILGHRS